MIEASFAIALLISFVVTTVRFRRKYGTRRNPKFPGAGR